MKYELFLVDADNTLYDYNAAENEALKAVFLEHGFSYDETVLSTYRAINRGLWDLLASNDITREELKTIRFQKLLSALNHSNDPVPFSQKYLAYLSQCPKLMEGAEDVCHEIIGRGGKIVLFTNGLSDVQRPRVANSPLARLFYALAISEEMGVQKPDAQMVHMAMEMGGHMDKQTTLIVGDSQKEDVGAGANANVDTCWLSHGRKSNKSLDEPTYIALDIRELPHFI